MPNNDKISLFYFNIRSLSSSFSIFSDFIDEQQPSVIGLCETWLNSNMLDSALTIPNYHLLRRDRDGRGGGVAFYIHNSLKFKLLRTDPGVSALESIWISIKVRGKSVCLGTLYRPPNINLTLCLDDLENIVSDFLPQYDYLLVGGDINVDFKNPNHNGVVLVNHFLNKYNLHQMVTEPTRLTNTAETLIDVVISSSSNLLCNITNIDMDDISDHCLLDCTLNVKKGKPEARVCTYRDYKNFIYNDFLNDMHSIDWNEIFNLSDVDEMVQFFNTRVEWLLNIHAPLKTSKFTKPPAPWLTDNLKFMIRLRKKALAKYKKIKTEGTRNEYKQLRNLVTMTLRNEKKAYFNHKFRVDPQSFWKTLKQLNINSSPRSFDTSWLDPDNLNNFFVNSIPTPNSDNNDLISNLYANRLHNGLISEFTFFQVTETKVEKIISSLKSNATGIDGINLKTLTLVTPYLIPHITFIINQCISNNKYPDLWKKANIIPVPKVNNPTEMSKLRPISILCTLSKVLEKIMFEQISAHVTNNKILPITQSGFRQAHSTTTALLTVADDIYGSLDKSECCCLVLLDCSKAFDTISHNILLKKLAYFGLSLPAIRFMESYLNDRNQRVLLDAGKASNFLSTNKGVPQGSILGPLLFSIYTADFPKHLLSCSSHQFADDFQIYFSFHPSQLDRAVTLINEDLVSIYNLSQAHGIILNDAKTQLLVFGSKMNEIVGDNNFKICLNNVTLNATNVGKNLGVVFNTCLRFDEHVSYLLQKSYGKLKILYMYKDFFDTDVKLRLTDSLILSYLAYSDILYWPALTIQNKNSLQKVQNSCLRFAYSLRKFDHISPCFVNSKWFNLSERYFIHIACLVFKISQTEQPQYLFQKLRKGSSVHQRITRHRDLYQVPRHSTAIFQRSFTYTAIKTYNSLPEYIKCCSSITSFKNHLKMHVLSLRTGINLLHVT